MDNPEPECQNAGGADLPQSVDASIWPPQIERDVGLSEKSAGRSAHTLILGFLFAFLAPWLVASPILFAAENSSRQSVDFGSGGIASLLGTRIVILGAAYVFRKELHRYTPGFWVGYVFAWLVDCSIYNFIWFTSR